ncbi:MAG: hypothetical protein M5T61_16855 [Acidimicrobiia bacterium]|nr:hypothetical protein [Acidimicrobiia bacterium]
MGSNEVLAQVDGRDEFDAVIAEPLDDTDQGQDRVMAPVAPLRSSIWPGWR